MNIPATLEDVLQLLRSGQTADELFGHDSPWMYHLLVGLCQPERNPADPRAASALAEVHRRYESLQAASIQSPRGRTYSLQQLWKTGDVADIYLGRLVGRDEKEKRSTSHVLKISRIPGGEALLDNERTILAELLTRAGDTTYRHYFPTLVESFPVQDEIRKRVNVFTHEQENFFSAEEVHEQWPAVDGRHLGWMFKRILTALGFAHRAGYVHGAVLPCHLRIGPGNHAVQLTSWGHAVAAGEIIASIPARYREWYPPEVLMRSPAEAGTDIYLAAQSMLYLAGIDPHLLGTAVVRQIPAAMQRFFQSCLLPGVKMRPDDAWDVHDEWDDLLVTHYGKPRFYHFPDTEKRSPSPPGGEGWGRGKVPDDFSPHPRPLSPGGEGRQTPRNEVHHGKHTLVR